MEISIIIPCFNHGHFIQDAIDSVETMIGIDYEIIIVDDGSSDVNTINKMNELREKGHNIITHKNSGLAFSRNVGVLNSRGKYVLPLDADNKIKAEYVYKALDILNRNEADIVYANPIFFGEINSNRCFKTKRFNANELFDENYIDACAIYRKEIWQNIGGYDDKMPCQGQEDWEFWINASVNGYKFHYIDEELYYYRVMRGSMIESTVNTGYGNLNHQYIVKKHLPSYLTSFKEMTVDSKIYNRDKSMPLRSSLKYFYKFLRSTILNQ